MKKIRDLFECIPLGFYVFIAVVGSLIRWAVISGNENNAKAEMLIHNLFAGEFEIKKFNVYDSKGAWLHGSFFLGSGSIDGGTTDDHMVSFCWKARSGEYIVSKIKVENIKVKIEPGLQKPYITFLGSFIDPPIAGDEVDTVNINKTFEQVMTMIIIHCNEDDFKTDVNINSLK
jgi:hypothetical protein